MEHEVKEIKRIIIWELTNEEIIALRSIIIGHGNLKKASIKTRIHYITLKRISITGKGYKQNIQRIRKKLLESIRTKDNNGTGIQQESGL